MEQNSITLTVDTLFVSLSLSVRKNKRFLKHEGDGIPVSQDWPSLVISRERIHNEQARKSFRNASPRARISIVKRIIKSFEKGEGGSCLALAFSARNCDPHSRPKSCETRPCEIPVSSLVSHRLKRFSFLQTPFFSYIAI